MRPIHRTVASAAALALALSTPALANPDDPGRLKVIYDPLILAGDPAPGMNQPFASFPYFTFVNDANYTIFLGSVTPNNDHSPEALFLAKHRNPNPGGGNPPQISLVTKLGQPAPGFPDGVTISGFDVNYHRANALGQAVFHAYLSGPGIIDTGEQNTNAHTGWIYSSATNSLSKLYQSQDPAPGIPGAFISATNGLAINDLGHVAFGANYHGSEEGAALFYGPPGNIHPIARPRDPVPGRPDYRYLSLFGFSALSPGGKLAFYSRVSPTGEWGPGGQDAIVIGDATNLQAVAISGGPAPGTNTGYRDLHLFTPIDVNNRGEASFAMNLTDGEQGLFAGAPGDVRLIARTDTPAPGLPGQTLDFFFGADINDRGEIVFNADVQLTDDDRRAIYLSRRNHDPELIAARGQRAPGTDQDVRFGWFFSDPVINKDGQVAFFASLDGQGSRGEGDYAIFATGHDGDLRLVARVGDSFEVSPGDSRTITALSHAGIFGSHILTFNEESNLSFLIKFDDGSQGIFTARVLPEPATLLLLPLSALVLRRRRA